jgi:hypothetical protein
VEEPLRNALPVAGECRNFLRSARPSINLDNGTLAVRGAFLWALDSRECRFKGSNSSWAEDLT